MVTRNKTRTEGPKILGTAGQKLVSWLSWCRGYGHTLLRALDLYRDVAAYDSDSLTQEPRLFIL